MGGGCDYCCCCCRRHRGKAFYEAKVSELVARTGATARSVEVDFLGQIHIRELALPLADGKNIRIAAIDGRPKFPFRMAHWS